jgi:hypothetical protein
MEIQPAGGRDPGRGQVALADGRQSASAARGRSGRSKLTEPRRDFRRHRTRRIVSHQVVLMCVQRQAISGQNCFQRLRSLHMKSWIIAALICSASAAYAAEDDNKIHPTCVEENNTRRCWVDHGPPAGVRPPQLQPVAPAPQAAIPPPPPRWLPPPLIFRFGPYGLIVPRRYPAPPAGRAPAY